MSKYKYCISLKKKKVSVCLFLYFVRHINKEVYRTTFFAMTHHGVLDQLTKRGNSSLHFDGEKDKQHYWNADTKTLKIR